MTGRLFGLQWDEGEPELVPWHEEELHFGEDGPMSLDDATASLTRFWRDRLAGAEEQLRKLRNLKACAVCGGVLNDPDDTTDLEHLDEDDDDHAPEVRQCT